MKNEDEFDAALKAQGITMASIKKRLADALRRGRSCVARWRSGCR